MSVALIVAAYNAESTIEQAISSALSQPDVTQVIVVDDASTDGTVAKIPDDDTGRVIILRQTVNTGPAAARNRALDIAAADWVGVLDADDFLLPGRISGLLEFSADADLIADDLWQVDENAIDGPRTLLLGVIERRCIGFDEFVLSNIMRGGRRRGEMGFIKPLMRREFLQRHGLRYREDMRLGEDFALYTHALALGARLILAPAQGYVSVVYAKSLSGQHSEADLLAFRESVSALESKLDLSPDNKAVLRRHYKSIDCRLQWRLLIDAVKKRDAKAAMATFLRPFPVPPYLLQRLWEQLYLRVIKKMEKL